MERKILGKLQEWKDKKDRMPLIIQGARQVGKTWAMQEFGKRCFEDTAYFNFDAVDYHSIFEHSIEPEVIVEKLGLIRGKKIEDGKTLLIFDEIQECPRVLNSLKYFCENAPQYHVVAAGSLLGTYLTGSFSYPVGKVNLLDMYPLTFEEFLQATDNKLHRAYATENDMVDILHKEFLDTYRKYLTIGGLPKSVQTWAETKDFAEVKKVQDQLQEVYETDFTKHVGKIEPAKILMIWRNVSAQLAKENKKFIYGDIQQGARARSFEEAIEWLVTANLVNRVYRATKNTMPLNVYTDLSAFKLYMFDTGLLKNMAGVPNESILLDKDFMFKGALVENYVLQELTPIFTATPPKYFTFNQYENDFLIQTQSGEIVPIEVKAGDRTDSPSFKVYNEKFNPKTRVMYSTLPLKWEHDRNCVNIPLYLVGKTKEILARI